MLVGLNLAFNVVLVTIQINSLDGTTLSYNEKQKKSQQAMIAFGIGELAGGLAIGKVVDTVGPKKACLLNTFSCVVMSVLTVYQVVSNRFGWVTFAMAFMWGWQDSSTNVHVYSILGFQFDDATMPFCAYNFIQGLSVFVFQMI